MPREAFFPLPGTTPPPVSLSLMCKQGTDVFFIELCVCPLALFVTSLTLCGSAFLGSACHLMCRPRLRSDIVGGGSYIDMGAALGAHSATVYRALWDVIHAVNSSTRRRSHDSGPTTRSCCHKLAGRGAAAPPP